MRKKYYTIKLSSVEDFELNRHEVFVTYDEARSLAQAFASCPKTSDTYYVRIFNNGRCIKKYIVEGK